MRAISEESVDRAIWAADCETDPFLYGRVPEPFAWGAVNIDSGEYVEFRETAQFLAWATAGPKIVYAHNGGKFDWHFIAMHIPLYQRIKVINGRLAKFKIGECEFRDSWNILPLPLSAFKKDEIDYAKFEREVREKHMAEILHYMRKDCEYLAELISAFIDEHGTALTLAGAAMRFFERLRGQKADKTHAGFYDEFAPYYAGGRVECFHTGVINRAFVSCDIRSAYPDAMKKAHPAGSVVSEFDELPDDDDRLSRAFITLTCESRGAFYYRGENGSLSFPNDGARRTFDVTGWEYIAARDTGALIDCEVHTVKTLAGTIRFDDYVDHWFGVKDSSAKETARYTISKLFLNSLYGKFGANPANYRDFETMKLVDVFAAELEGWELENIEGDIAFMSQPTPEFAQRYYNVATAASITGCVRAKLWRAICAVDTPLYCDTDNVTCIDPRDLDIRAGLGGWEIDATCKRGFIAGKKLYAFELAKPDKNGKKWKTASKGVKLSPEQIVKVAKGAEMVYESDAPTFRIGANVLYPDESIGYVKRDVAFTRRTVRITRPVAETGDIELWPKNRRSAKKQPPNSRELALLFRARQQ